MDQTYTTLSHYLLEQLADHPKQKEIITILSDLATIGKIISRETSRAGLANIFGAAGGINAHAEEQQKLDVFANELCKNFLRRSGSFCALASEEEVGVVPVGDGRFVVAFDPLDGSSNIEVNGLIGTIFSVYERLPELAADDPRHFFQTGRKQVLAGYLLYGPSTVLVFSFGDGVHEFTLDPHVGEFLLSRESMRFPEVTTMYSFNETNLPFTRPKERAFIDYMRGEKQYGGRYFAALVADFHRNLLKGGVFLYPVLDKKGTGTYVGKLRLQFEAKPMAFLAEQAGGLAVDGNKNILDIISTDIHQCVGLIIGEKNIIERYLTTY